MAENQWVCPGVLFTPISEPWKKPSYFPLYWLLHRDPYHCLWNNPHITGVVCHPAKNTLNSQGPFFHGSLVTSPILNIKISKISFWISCQLLLFHGIPLQRIVGGWTNPLENMLVKLASFPQTSGWKFQKYLSCHHLGRVNSSIHPFIKAIYRGYFTPSKYHSLGGNRGIPWNIFPPADSARPPGRQGGGQGQGSVVPILGSKSNSPVIYLPIQPIHIYIYIPRTQMTPVLIGKKTLVLEGFEAQNIEDTQVPGM